MVAWVLPIHPHLQNSNCSTKRLCAERSLLEVLRRPYALTGIESIINQLHKRCIFSSHTMSPVLLSISLILVPPPKPAIAENLASDAWQVLWHWKPLAVLATTSVWLLSSGHVLLTWLSSMKLMWLSCTGLLELSSWRCPNLSQSFLQLLLGFSPIGCNSPSTQSESHSQSEARN